MSEAHKIAIAPLAVAGIDLKPGATPISGMVYGQSVTLAPAAPQVRYSLRAKDPAVLASVLGHTLPERIGTHQDGIARLSPDEWYAILPASSPLPFRGGAGGVASPLGSAPGDRPHPNPSPEGEGLYSMVDVTARSVGFTLSGPGAVLALSRGCPLDVSKFTPGRATRTVFEDVEIQIWATAPDQFHVEVWRSFAPWLWHALAEAII